MTLADRVSSPKLVMDSPLVLLAGSPLPLPLKPLREDDVFCLLFGGTGVLKAIREII